MDSIDLGCRSFPTRLLFSMLLALAFVSLFADGLPEAPYWAATFVYLVSDLLFLSLFAARKRMKEYVEHGISLLFPSAFGTGLALFLWGTWKEGAVWVGVVSGVGASILLLAYRAIVLREAIAISGVAPMEET